MNKQEKVNEIKKELIKLAPFRRGCEVCRVTWHKSGMTFHHIIYKNNERTRKDFPEGYGGMMEYYIYITPIIKKFPQRFALLCNTCTRRDFVRCLLSTIMTEPSLRNAERGNCVT